MPRIKSFQIDVTELGGSLTLNTIGDVNITSVAPGEIMFYGGSPIGWRNATLAEAGIEGANNWITANNGADFSITPVAPGIGSISIGNGAGLGSPTIDGTISIGEVAHARGNYSIAIGQEAVADSVEAFGGWASIAIGYQAITRGYENIAIGEAAQAGYIKDAGSTLTGTIAIGAYTNAYATDCTAVGYQAIASGFTGSPLGSPLSATDKQRATAFGAYATAKSQDSLALGANAIVGGTQGQRVGGIAVGANADCRGTNSIALGYSTQTNLDYATTIGYNLTNTTASSVMIGQAAHGSPIETFYMLMSDNGVLTLSGAKAQYVHPNYTTAGLPVGVLGGTVFDTDTVEIKVYNGSAWVPLGSYNWLIGNAGANFTTAPLAPGINSIAIGNNAVSGSGSPTYQESIAIGSNTVASQSYTVALGTSSTAYGLSSVSVGNLATARERYTVAIGYNALAGQTNGAITDEGGTAVGANAIADRIGGVAIGQGSDCGANYATAVGYGAGPGGAYSVGIGYNNIPTGTDSVCIGRDAQTKDQRNIAIGKNAFSGSTAGTNTFVGYETIAIGYNAKAYQTSCIAIGSGTTGAIAGRVGATTNPGNHAIAIGPDAIADFDYAIALGANAAAYADNSISIGTNVVSGATGSPPTITHPITIGHNLTNVTSNSVMLGIGAYGSPVGTGSPATTEFFMLLSDNGVLTLTGDKAQYVQPNYTTAGLPVGVEGGTVYDTDLNKVKVYDGAAWVGVPKEYYINITTGQAYGSPNGSPLPPGIGSPAIGSPTLGILETSLPSGWYTIYNGVGNFTVVHNLGTTEVGFALSVLFSTTGRTINPTAITSNDITFQITSTADSAVEGNVIGKLLF